MFGRKRSRFCLVAKHDSLFHPLRSSFQCNMLNQRCRKLEQSPLWVGRRNSWGTSYKRKVQLFSLYIFRSHFRFFIIRSFSDPFKQLWCLMKLQTHHRYIFTAKQPKIQGSRNMAYTMWSWVVSSIPIKKLQVINAAKVNVALYRSPAEFDRRRFLRRANVRWKIPASFLLFMVWCQIQRQHYFKPDSL